MGFILSLWNDDGFFFLIIGKESDGEDLIGEDEGEEYFFLEYLVV